MSSFVIAKKEYHKVAGFLAAIVETKNYYREPVLCLWNKTENRLYTANDVLRDFSRLYRINAEAVAHQYHIEKEEDTTVYDTDFLATKEAAADLMRRGYSLESSDARMELQRVVYCCISFFRSALYQIEGDEFQRRAFMVLNKYFRGLYDVLQKLDGVNSEDATCWGAFGALDPKEE